MFTFNTGGDSYTAPFDRVTFLKNIIYAAKAKNISVAKLEEKADMSRGYLNRLINLYEGKANTKVPENNNRKLASIEQFYIISQELEIPLNFLIDYNLKEFSPKEAPLVDFMMKLHEATISNHFKWNKVQSNNSNKLELEQYIDELPSYISTANCKKTSNVSLSENDIGFIYECITKEGKAIYILPQYKFDKISNEVTIHANVVLHRQQSLPRVIIKSETATNTLRRVVSDLILEIKRQAADKADAEEVMDYLSDFVECLVNTNKKGED